MAKKLSKSMQEKLSKECDDLNKLVMELLEGCNGAVVLSVLSNLYIRIALTVGMKKCDAIDKLGLLWDLMESEKKSHE